MRLVVPYIITDDTFVSSTIAETDEAAYSAATTYAVGARVMLAHKRYESLQAGNVDHDPASSPTWWLYLGPTNRWAMFDGVGSAATTASGGFTTTVTVGPLNDIAFTEIAASSVTITLPDQTITRSVPAPVAPATTSSLYITDIASDGGTLEIEVNGSGDVSVGALSIGTITVIGETQHGSGLGIIDYSRRSVDQFGSANFTRRGYSKRVTARVTLLTTDVDRVADILSAVRSVPVVWIPTEAYSSMLILGYYKDWEIEVTSYELSTLTITIESVVQDSLGVTAPPAPPPPPPPGGGGGGGEGTPVRVTFESVVDSEGYSGATATVAWYFDLLADGRARSRRFVNGSEDYVNYHDFPVNSWADATIPIASGSAALYEARFGTGAWQSLSTDRSVLVISGSSSPSQTGSVVVQIRRVSDGVVLASMAFRANTGI